MDLQRLVEIAQEFEDNGGHRPGPRRGHGPGGRGRRRRLSRTTLLRLLGPKQRRQREKNETFKSQAGFANSTGRSRTNDFLIPSEAGSTARGRSGKGRWKSWTPEAIQRAAFANENMAVRHTAEQVDGGSASHAMECRLFVSQLVLKGQQTGLARFLEQAKYDTNQGEMQFALTNMIFDETELELNLHEYGQGAWSVLASHAQMAFRVNGHTHDFDFIRLPVAIPNKQACTMWPALCAGDGGLWPGLSLVKAKLRAILVTCDAAPANIKLLKHLLCVLDDRTLLLPLLCLQHRTGNVVERVTKLLSILPGSYAVSKTLRSGFVVRKLTQCVRTVLAQKLQVLDQVPPGLQEEWATGQVTARQIFDLVNAGEDEKGERKAACKELLEFFAGPWTGPGLGWVCLNLWLKCSK